MTTIEIKQILEAVADKLKNLQVPEVIPLTGNKNKFVELKDEFKKDWTNVVYIFSAKTLPPVCKDVESIKIKFEEINNKNKKRRCMPQINEEHWNVQNQDIHYLYVGSCKSNSKGRMKDHLCNLANTTYALHLKEWWTGDEEFNIDVFVFGNTLSDRGNLQLIEDIIWQDRKPLFGKKGSK
ncbi:hypothetical protein FACS1894102_1700 [Spirochaetia bacterium]|nr:hypothetical protein FACS1894102_1700 [Spirochaetia bacterium]